jgi:GWxTD domain-containing protein
MKKWNIALLLLGVMLTLGPAALAQKPKAAPAAAKLPKLDEKSLPVQFRDFLDLTAYIITSAEKDVFLQLTNDRDREIFIQNFWKLRDPTPGTPENEYREEIVKRFNYANKKFTTGRPGWKTDRGKFYIILGEPRSYDRYPGTLGLVPCEVWYYFTDGTKGLPGHFGLIFYQKGAGDYRLYDPFMDGPKTLIENMASTAQLTATDYESLYDKIRELAPALASMTISLTPGDYDGFAYQPSPRNTMILANIIESPKADIRPTYATHFSRL